MHDSEIQKEIQETRARWVNSKPENTPHPSGMSQRAAVWCNMVVKLREAYGAVDTSATTELPSGQKDTVVKYESSPQATWEQAIARWKQGTEKTQLLAAMEPSVMERDLPLEAEHV